MGDLTPIDVDRLSGRDLNRALVNGIVQTHACLEAHIAEQARVNAEVRLAHLDATEKRVAMASDFLTVKEDVHALAMALGVKKPGEGEQKPKAHALATWGPVRALTALSGMSFGLIVMIQLADKLGPDVGALIVKAWHYLVTLQP